MPPPAKPVKAQIIVFAQTPPPEHGQSRMVAEMLRVFEESDDSPEIHHVNARFSMSMDDIGVQTLRKLVLTFRYIVECLQIRRKLCQPILYYIPGPVKWSAVIRDWLLLTSMRPWFPELVFHWHAIGHGEWAHGSQRLKLPGPRMLDRAARGVSRFLLQKPSLSIAVSHNSTTDARAVASQWTVVVPNGIQDPWSNFETTLGPARLARARTLARNPSEPVRVLFLSRGSLEKGLLDALDATGHWLEDKQSQNRPLHLTLAGGMDEDIDTLAQERIHRLRELYGSRFTCDVLDFVEGRKKIACYEQADVFLSASHWESFGLTVVEAMAAGLPIVAAASDGVSGVLPPAYPFLSPVRNSAGLAVNIEKVLRQICATHFHEFMIELRRHFLGHYTHDVFEKGIRNALASSSFQPADTLIEINDRRGELTQVTRDHYEGNFQAEHNDGHIKTARDAAWPMARPHVEKPAANDGAPPQAASARILQVFNQYSEQGGEQLWVDQVTALATEALQIHELRFLSRTWKMPGAPSPIKQALRIWDNPESRRRLRREVESLKPDVLLFHNLIPVASFGLYDEARNLGLPVLQYIHNFRPFSPSGTLWADGRICNDALSGSAMAEIVTGAWEHSRLKTAILAMHLRRLRNSGWLDAVDRWIAVSDFMRHKFVEAGLPPEKVVTLRHCWPPHHDGSRTEEDDYYLFIGRLVEEKGVGTLIDAWTILKAKLGDKCPRLVIAGTGSEESNMIAACARNKRIETVGFVTGEPKQRLLRGCRAVLAPSIWWEPLGLIVYEAYDYGKPVVAARSGGLVETVQEGKGGFLHDPGDAQSLAQAIIRLEELGETGRQTMGATGRKWLFEHASPEVWRKKFHTIVNQVR